MTDGGRPVPYLLLQPPQPEREWIGGSILSVAATKKTSGFEVDLGAARAVDMVRIEGLPAPYLKRLTLEGSGDRARWTTLVAEGTLFDLPDEQLRQNSLGFAPGPYRYLRVTWNDANSGRVPNPRAVAARRVSAAPPPPATTLAAAIERGRASQASAGFACGCRRRGCRLSRSSSRLEWAGPAATSIAGRSSSESRFAGLEAAPVELGRAMLSRVVRDGADSRRRSGCRSPPRRRPRSSSTIDDGANEPLDLRAVSVVLAELPWIYFEAPAGAVMARYGDRTLPRPAYDLEAVRGSVDLAKVPEAKWGEGRTTRMTRGAGASGGARAGRRPDARCRSVQVHAGHRVHSGNRAEGHWPRRAAARCARPRSQPGSRRAIRRRARARRRQSADSVSPRASQRAACRSI